MTNASNSDDADKQCFGLVVFSFFVLRQCGVPFLSGFILVSHHTANLTVR